jgi:glycosyltransferase involved in cell wall biosynthesis
MRILIVSMLFYPDRRIGGIRPSNFAKHLAASGHDVTVLTTRKAKSDTIDGITTRQIGMSRLVNALNERVMRHHDMRQEVKPADSPPASGGGPGALRTAALLLLDHIRGASWKRRCRHAFKKRGTGCYDIIISSFGPVGSFLTGRMLRRMNIAPLWICDLRDRIQNARYPACFNMLYRRYERAAAHKADAVILVSEGQKEGFIRDNRLTHTEKVHIIHNGYETAPMPERGEDRKDRELRLCYTGTLYSRYEAMQFLLDVLAACSGEGSDNNIVLHYAGPDGARMMAMTKSSGVRFSDHGLVPRTQAIELQRNSDILVALAWNEPDSLGILSGKFFEYMAAKKPVVSVVEGSLPHAEMTDMVKRLHLGIACETASRVQDAGQLRDYMLMQSRRRMNGEPALYEADTSEIGEYDYAHLVSELESICTDVVMRKPHCQKDEN